MRLMRASNIALQTEIATTFQQAELFFGTWSQGLGTRGGGIVSDDVYASLPAHLQYQRHELCGNVPPQQKEELSILSFEEASQGAAG